MKRFEMAFLTCSMVLLMFSSLNASAQQTKPKEKDAVAYDVPHMDEVIIHKDIPYLKTPDSALKMDIYYPPKFNFNSKIPAVVFVYAYTNDGQLKAVGKQFRKWIAYTSWCRVVAASGMAAIAYETVNPVNDLNSLLQYVKTNADKLNIDANKIGAYAGSANTTTALAYILNDTNSIFKCAAINYGIFLCTDFKHLSLMDTLSQNMGFVTPRLSEPVSWNKKVPLMIVHVGKDFVPHSDESLTGFVDKAINQKVPFTLIHYATGIHGFDVWADDETTRQIIKTTLDFWKFYLK
jgi:dipeptidyl aminopeptidase/acylaminoacyl peptidase